jgi:hypothetical protein
MRFERQLVLGLWFSVMLAIAAPAAAQPVAVSSAEPSVGEQESVGLQVRVKGKGFANGARAEFLLDDNSNGGITVRSTAFVSSTELLATVDIAAGASLSLFDIRVANLNGRTGRGSDLFQVVEKGRAGGACLPSPLPAGVVELLRLSPAAAVGTTKNLGTALVTRSATVNGVETVAVLVANGAKVEIYFLTEGPGGLQVDSVQAHQSVTLSTASEWIRSIAVGDVNGDGTFDFAAGDLTRAALFLGTRAAPGGPITFAAGIPLDNGHFSYNYALGLAMGDLDGVPGDEIALTQTPAKSGKKVSPGAISVFKYGGGTTASVLRVLVPSPNGDADGFARHIALADADGDNDLDIVTSAPMRDHSGATDAGEIWVFPGPVTNLDADGNPGNGAQPIVLRSATPLTGDSLSKVATGDVVGVIDGGVDIVAATSWGNSSIRGEVFRAPFISGGSSDPAFVFAPTPGLDKGWTTTGPDVADVNGDGYADILAGAPNATPSSACDSVGAAYLFLGDGAGNWRRVRLGPPSYADAFIAYGWAMEFAQLGSARLLIISAHGTDVGGIQNAGQVYVYRVDTP